MRDIPTEVAVGSAEGVVEVSVANLDDVQLVPVERLLRPAGSVDPGGWPQFCTAMATATAC